MESEYMVYFFIQNKKTTALQVHSLKFMKAETGIRFLLRE